MSYVIILIAALVSTASGVVTTIDVTRNASDKIVITGHDLKKTVDCAGHDVIVDANDSVLTIRGECNEVQVNGSTNTITLNVVAKIVLNSADNVVRWKKAAKGDKPVVVNHATGNKVEQVK